MIKIGNCDMIDIEKLVSNRDEFNSFVYTSIDNALKEIELRRANVDLKKIVDFFLCEDIPKPFQEKTKGVILRNIITPNHEMMRFLHIIENVDNITPLLCEYPDDKFVPSNKLKRFLGKLSLFINRDKNDCLIIEKAEIIDFDSAKGKKISEIKTVWGEYLVDFHHELFEEKIPGMKKYIFDISPWYKKHGPTAKKFYDPLMALFIKDSILFENFLLEDKKGELPFIKNIFLPSFIKIWKLTGKKPLIVALEPTKIEGDSFWLCYPHIFKKFIDNKSKMIN